MSHPASPSHCADRTILSSTSANTSPQKPSTSSVEKSDQKRDTENGQQQQQKQQHSMDFHRQVLKGKLEDDANGAKYISPSDGIMSPCTQKLSALKGRHFGKAKPKSLFAQTQMAAVKQNGDGNGDNVEGEENREGTGLGKEE